MDKQIPYGKQGVLNVVLILCSVVVAVIFSSSIVYLFSGSLESFPTPQQEEEVYAVFGLTALGCLAVEYFLFLIYKRVNSSAKQED